MPRLKVVVKSGQLSERQRSTLLPVFSFAVSELSSRLRSMRAAEMQEAQKTVWMSTNGMDPG